MLCLRNSLSHVPNIGENGRRDYSVTTDFHLYLLQIPTDGGKVYNVYSRFIPSLLSLITSYYQLSPLIIGHYLGTYLAELKMQEWLLGPQSKYI